MSEVGERSRPRPVSLDTARTRNRVPTTAEIALRPASVEPMFGRHGWSSKYRRRLAISDVFVVTLVLIGAHAVRFGPDLLEPVAGKSAPGYWFVSLTIGIGWLVALTWTHSREARVLGHGPQEFTRVMRAGWHVFAVVAIVGFLTQWQVSRGYLIMAIPVGTAVLLAYRQLWRMWIHAQRDAGLLQAQVLVVGSLDTAEEMVRRLQRARRAGYNVVGVCLPSHVRPTDVSSIRGVPVLGPLVNPVVQARSVGAEFVVLCGNDAMSLNESRRLGWSLEGEDIGLIVAPGLVDVAGPRVAMSPVEGLPLLHVDVPTFSGTKYYLKSLADMAVAAALVVALALPMAVVAIAVALTSRGPVLFRQERVGVDRQVFTMFKFRTMYDDAEARLAELEHLNESDGALFKLRDDPRVTSVGRILRRYSLDELPQLFNVLRGEMSLVGPRPPLPREMASWDDDVGRRQLVKPGITGLWQVSGRSDLTWDESVRLDLYYTENWSLTGDFIILCRTALAVLARRGAY